MAKYTVKIRFKDKFTKDIYPIGAEYVSDDESRVKYLQDEGYLDVEYISNDENIFPKHTGGGWYDLSNGEKVKGKDEATAAEEELQKSGE